MMWREATLTFLFQHLPRGTEENHRKSQPEYSVSLTGLKPRIPPVGRFNARAKPEVDAHRCNEQWRENHDTFLPIDWNDEFCRYHFYLPFPPLCWNSQTCYYSWRNIFVCVCLQFECKWNLKCGPLKEIKIFSVWFKQLWNKKRNGRYKWHINKLT
jgi:hypothetical protein